ncbi:EF-hand domain-containing protein [Plastorhodobacter daqingensis]|uniref:EF-hand domain-containing protein n=1 Tax=Plastorhodobacter daqingensis TaxID=1387281 RepID=A0ABW2UFW4_9RHOB
MTGKKHLITAAILAAVGATATFGSIAMAQPGQMRGGPGAGFAQFDLDGDGQITAEEIETLRARQTEGLDADGDGLLSAEEIAAHHMRQMQAMIEARAEGLVGMLDRDGDGLLSATELAASRVALVPSMPLPDIARLDTDGDGQISEAEFDAGRRAMREAMRDGKQRARDGQQGQRREHRPMMRGEGPGQPPASRAPVEAPPAQ